jgi:hypothetical protein
LVALFGEPTTETNRTNRGRIVRSLKQAGATPEEIAARVASWPDHFEEATLTENALEVHWDRLGRPPARATPAQVRRRSQEIDQASLVERLGDRR